MSPTLQHPQRFNALNALNASMLSTLQRSQCFNALNASMLSMLQRPQCPQHPQHFNISMSSTPQCSQCPQHFNILKASMPSTLQHFNILKASTPSTSRLLQCVNAIKSSTLNVSILKASMPQCLNVLTSSTPQHFNFALSMIKAKWSILFVVINDKVRRTAEPIATRLFHALFNMSASFWCPIFNHGCCSVDFGNTSR